MSEIEVSFNFLGDLSIIYSNMKMAVVETRRVTTSIGVKPNTYKFFTNQPTVPQSAAPIIMNRKALFKVAFPLGIKYFIVYWLYQIISILLMKSLNFNEYGNDSNREVVGWFVDQLVELISLIRISPFGLMVVIIMVTLICYLIIKPLVRWFVLLKQDRILSYVMCSLLILISTISLGFTFWDTDFFYLIKITLLCMAVTGGILVIARFIHYVFQLIFTKEV